MKTAPSQRAHVNCNLVFLQYIQKKDPNYNEVKNETVWTIEHMNEYVNKHFREKKNLPMNWVQSVLQVSAYL